MKHPAEPESNPTVAHEWTDADTHAITKFGIGLALTVVAAHLLLWWMFAHFSAREEMASPPVPALVKAQAPKEPPEPRLQPSPPLDLRRMLADEDAVLNHYGWVDPEHGVVRLPVQRALEIVAERGLPQFKSGAGGAKQPAPR